MLEGSGRAGGWRGEISFPQALLPSDPAAVLEKLESVRFRDELPRRLYCAKSCWRSRNATVRKPPRWPSRSQIRQPLAGPG